MDARIGAFDYFDLAVSADIGEKYNVRLGVENVFDRRPPIVGSNANPQILPGNLVASIYDSFGRYMFVGVSAKF